jgi:tRNA 2-thiouridine synthesizing protein C
MVNKILLVIKSPPHGNGRSAEGFRMATAMIAMDLLPQMLFMDDGVYCLVRNRAPKAAGSVSFTERLKTISDLVGIQVLSDSLLQRDLKPSDMDESYDAKALTLDEAANLLWQNDVVVTF